MGKLVPHYVSGVFGRDDERLGRMDKPMVVEREALQDSCLTCG